MAKDRNLLVLPRVFKQHLALEKNSECEHDWKPCLQKPLDGYLRCKMCGGWAAYAALPPLDVYHDKETSEEIYRRVLAQTKIYNMTIVFLAGLWGKAYKKAVKAAAEKGFSVPLLSEVEKHLPSRNALFQQVTVWRHKNPHLNKGLLDVCRAGADAALRAFLLRADKYLQGERNIQKVRDSNQKQREKNQRLKGKTRKQMSHPTRQDQRWASIDMCNPQRLLKNENPEEHISGKTTLLSLASADVLEGNIFKIPSMEKRAWPLTAKKRIPQGLWVRNVIVAETETSLRSRHRTGPPEHRKYCLRAVCLVRIPAPPTAAETEMFSSGYDTGGHRPCVSSSGDVFVQPDMTESFRRSGNHQRESTRNTKHGSRKQKKFAHKAAKENAVRTRRKTASEQRYASNELKANRLVSFEDTSYNNLRRSKQGTRTTPGRGVAAKKKSNRTMDTAAPGRIRSTFAQSAKFHGSYFTEVPAAYTSQTCSVCRKRLWRRLESWEPYFVCGSFDCRNQMQRDQNAGRNVDRKGRKRMAELEEIYPEIFGAAAREQAEKPVVVRGEGLEADLGLCSSVLVADVRPDPRQLHPHVRDIKACGSPRDTKAAAQPHKKEANRNSGKLCI